MTLKCIHLVCEINSHAGLLHLPNLWSYFKGCHKTKHCVLGTMSQESCNMLVIPDNWVHDIAGLMKSDVSGQRAQIWHVTVKMTTYSVFITTPWQQYILLSVLYPASNIFCCLYYILPATYSVVCTTPCQQHILYLPAPKG